MIDVNENERIISSEEKLKKVRYRYIQQEIAFLKSKNRRIKRIRFLMICRELLKGSSLNDAKEKAKENNPYIDINAERKN